MLKGNIECKKILTTEHTEHTAKQKNSLRSNFFIL